MVTSLGVGLARVLDDFAAEKASHPNTADSGLPAFIRGDLAEAVASVARSAGWPHRVKGSAGAGVWAETPWVAAFDEDITSSAQRGFYVVYLFRTDGAAVYLTLDQGTTEVHDDFGRNYLTVLRQRADEATRLLVADGALHATHGRGPVDLGATGDLSRGYEEGAIAHIRYARIALPGNENDLRADLLRILVVYRRLVDLRLDLGLIAPEEEPPAGVESGKFRWHRSRERNRRLAEQIKKSRGYDCEVCGINFRKRYPSIGRDYIEAHHLTPISALGGRPTNVGVNDFVVVCPNCHRMLHTANPPIPPTKLKVALGPLT
jgi:5-methylcytosine-specific restriction protein A